MNELVQTKKKMHAVTCARKMIISNNCNTNFLQFNTVMFNNVKLMLKVLAL